MKKYAVLVLFVCAVRSPLAQSIISGAVTDGLDQAVNGASVTISEPGTDGILAYALTDAKGTYRIQFKSDLKKIQLNARALGYHDVHKTIENKSQIIDFSLREAAIKLREVIVKVPPIKRSGDTISYNVQSFADKKDRSIADVLAKMPGIEVLSDGQVLYQGKALNKFYIDGLDLLEGKYNLATENLPHDKVSQVQVLENHQPIKILDTVVSSDRAALNIKLKNKVSFTGKAETGTGFSPLLWDINATPMLFTPKRQMISAYQANNIGGDAASQLKTLTIENLLENLGNDYAKRDLLGTQPSNTPNLPQKRWLDNNVHLLTTNGLIALKKDYQLRVNISYLNDYQRREAYTSTVFFTPTDRVSTVENKRDRLHFNSLKAHVTLEKNTSGNYLKNSLQFQGFWDSKNGSISRDPEPLTQNLSDRYFEFSNTLNSIFPLYKNLVHLHSSIVFSKTPQDLILRPAPFQDLLTDGKDCESATQNTDLKSFYTDNSIGFTKAWKRFTYSPKIGLQIEKQNLESKIETNPRVDLGKEFSNDLDRLRTQTYFDTRIQYKKDDWRIEFNAPINYYTFKLKDRPLQKEQSLNRPTFEPRLSAIYDLNAFWKATASCGLSNSFGTGREIHYAYILRSYRNMERTDTPLSETFTKNFNADISYRNPIRSLFAHMSYSHSTSENNSLYVNKIRSDGTDEVQALARDNERKSHQISSEISKYLSALKTNISINTRFSVQYFQEIINSDEISDIKNQNLYIKLKADIDITDYLGLAYQTDWFFAKSSIQNRKNQNISDQTHRLSLDIYPKDNRYIGIRAAYFQNDLLSAETSHFFADLVYRYSLKKVDFELQWNNIFNVENYKNSIVDDFGYIETGFRLRPRQILCKISFSL